MIHTPNLEVNIVGHCNNRCAACNHASPFSEPWFLGLDEFGKDLDSFRKLIRVKRLSILGGEPLLHPGIADFINLARASKIAEEVWVITNGNLISQMPMEFWRALDVLKITVYPNFRESQMGRAKFMQQNNGFRLETESVTTFYKVFERCENPEHFTSCPARINCLTMHKGHLYLCPQSALLPERFMGFDPREDGLKMAGALESDVRMFLARTVAPRACQFCHNAKAPIPWHQCSTQEEWLKDSTL